MASAGLVRIGGCLNTPRGRLEDIQEDVDEQLEQSQEQQEDLQRELDQEAGE